MYFITVLVLSSVVVLGQKPSQVGQGKGSPTNVGPKDPFRLDDPLGKPQSEVLVGPSSPDAYEPPRTGLGKGQEQRPKGRGQNRRPSNKPRGRKPHPKHETRPNKQGRKPQRPNGPAKQRQNERRRENKPKPNKPNMPN